MDKNIVLLEGRIGADFKYLKTKTKQDYATFTLYVMSYDAKLRDSSETKVETKVRIMCFDPVQVEYLRKVSAREGNRVSIFGRINTRTTEIRGNFYAMMDVVVRDIKLLKTS